MLFNHDLLRIDLCLGLLERGTQHAKIQFDQADFLPLDGGRALVGDSALALSLGPQQGLFCRIQRVA